MPDGPAKSQFVIIRSSSWTCALPLRLVEETLRPLLLEEIQDSPVFVRGLSIIRGTPVPVVDLAVLLGAKSATDPHRLVIVRVEERRVALAVDEVLGVREIEDSILREVPPLLAGKGDGVVEALGLLDSKLLAVLRAGALLPDEVRSPVLIGETA